MEATIRLYKEELDLCYEEINLLKEKNSKKEEENELLLKKNEELNKLVNQTSVVTRDLHSALDKANQQRQRSIVSPGHHDHSMVDESQLALENVQQEFVELAHGSVFWLSQKDKMIQKINNLQRECERYSRDNSTLTKQVRHLIKTLEEERGTIIRRPEPVGYPNEKCTALEVIDNRLVTFSSIEELQEQNMKLLSIVKEYAKEDEERQMEIENDEIKRLTDEVISVKKQLEEVKTEREHVIEAYNTIFKERDLFKVLLCNSKTVENMTPEIFQKMVSIAVQSGPSICGVPEDTRDKDAHISDLKEVISKLEKEIAQLRQEFQTSRTRMEQELKLKTELLQTEKTNRILDIKKLQTLDENNKILVNDNEQLRTQNHRLVMDLEKKSDLKERLEKDYSEKITHLENLLGNTKNVGDMTMEIFERINSIADAKANEIQESSHKDAEIEELNSEIMVLRQNFMDLQQEFESSNKKHDEQLEAKNQLLGSKERQLDNLCAEKTSLEQSCNTTIAELEGKNRQLSVDLEKLQAQIQRLDNELAQKSEETHKKDPDYARISTLFRLRNIERARRLNHTRKMKRKLTKDNESQTDNAAPRIVLKRRT